MAAVMDRAEQIRTESALLQKAERDIETGWKRIGNQEALLRELEAGGHDTREAERLVALMKETLLEWERHRVLIEQRLAYLRSESFPPGFKDG